MGAMLTEVRRGEVIEAVHRGHAAVVDCGGRLLYRAGDPRHVTYLRSAAKPLQALPLVESGAAGRLGLTEAELAVCCASHNGEPEHLEAVRRILAKVGLGPEALLCGTHPVWHGAVRESLAREGGKPTVLHNNCSGKHAGMLALAVHQGWPVQGYNEPGHPVQRAMLQAVADLAGLPADELALGVDGCTVPTFGMPLYHMALAFARLAGPHGASPHGAGLPPARAASLARLRDAMARHPHLMAGSDRFDSDLGRASGGRLIGKVGAEGVFCVAVPERGWGLAMKVVDGNTRGLFPAVLKALDDLDLLRPDEREALADHYHPVVKNNRGEPVGEIRSVLRLIPEA